MITLNHSVSIFRLNQTELKIVLFLLIISLYALFSEPTPDEIRLQEILIGILLVFFTGIKGALNLVGGFFFEKANHSIPKYLYLTFFYLLIVPFTYGIIFIDNNIYDVIRDVIPFLYFYLPLVFFPLMKKNSDIWINVLLFSICFIGISYAIRFFIEGGIDPRNIGKSVFFGTLSYIQMSPEVLFSAVFLLSYGINNLLNGRIKKGVTFTFLGLIPYSAILANVTRAQIILVAFSIIFIVVVNILKKPFNIIFIIPFVFLVFNMYEIILGVVNLVIEKFRAVGLSGREAEALAVLNNAFSSVPKFLLGEGWGGLLANPIGGGAKWRFVHNVIFYFIFKTGFIGLTMFIIYLLYIFYTFVKFIFKINNAFKIELALAFISFFIVHLLLETGYKMLGSGLILLLLFLLSHSEKCELRGLKA